MSKSTMADGAKYYVTCTSLITLCSMALFFLLLSWAIGGDEYKDKFLGDYVIPLLIMGIAAGLALKVVSLRRQRADSMGSESVAVTPCNTGDSTQGLA